MSDLEASERESCPSGQAIRILFLFTQNAKDDGLDEDLVSERIIAILNEANLRNDIQSTYLNAGCKLLEGWTEEVEMEDQENIL